MPHVHELIPLGGLPRFGERQWFASDAIPDAYREHVGLVLVLADDNQTVFAGRRLHTGVIEHEPLPQGLNLRFWCLPPELPAGQQWHGLDDPHDDRSGPVIVLLDDGTEQFGLKNGDQIGLSQRTPRRILAWRFG